MTSSDYVTLFFLVAAVVIFIQLRSVLGRRTGHEKQPFETLSPRDDASPPDNGKVVTLPRRDLVDDEDRMAELDQLAKPGSEVNAGLRAIAAEDPGFGPKKFIDGARMAYEMIVMGFADGDRKVLKPLLSPEVYDGFEAAIREREQRGETVKSTFVGIDKIDVVSAELKGGQAQITLRILSQLISATHDRAGKVVDGDLETVCDVNDVWTFARDVRDSNPNWKLIATEADQ